MPMVSIIVNGEQCISQVDGTALLVEFLREKLRLTGTHVGCDTSQCGCCTVLVDNMAIKSCTMLVLQADGKSVTTIEGLAAEDGTWHSVQTAMRKHHGVQCGFCTPGMVMSLVDFLGKNSNPTEDEVRAALDGNLCRCTGYQGIVDAALAAAREIRNDARANPHA